MISLFAIPPIYNPAIDPKIGSPSAIPGGLTATAYVIQLFVKNFIALAFTVGGLVFFAMLLMGAIEYITAGGEKEKVGNASKRLTTALIGLTILLSFFIILKLVKTIFGIDLLQVTIPVIP